MSGLPRTLLLCLFCCLPLLAQRAPVAETNRVPDAADLSQTTRLPKHVPAWAFTAADAGAVPAETELPLTFVLARSAPVQAAFEQMLADQQNPSSPSYHKFLTPAQVGAQYGPTAHDLAALSAWLTAQGLRVTSVAPSGTFVSTTASAGVDGQALGTSFHLFHMGRHTRFSAISDPAIPTAFASLIQSVAGLSDATLTPQSPAPVRVPASPSDQPELTSTTGNHYISPGDFAILYDTNPLLNAGINGSGVHVAIIGRSRVAPSDLAQYESLTGLPQNLPNTIVAPEGVDPGTATDGDESEAALDLERVIGTAPQVSADLVISGNGSTGLIDGLFIAAQYNVQTLLDPVMTISFGACEYAAGLPSVTLWDHLFSQAAAEGISSFVSSADSAADTCAPDFSAPTTNQLLNINYICSSSYVTCVGGTELADAANPGAYWAATNSSTLVSALGPIPEGGWNEPLSSTGALMVSGSGGGASVYIAKPAWQKGTGVPADGQRDVPDVAFPAAGHDAYLFCNASVGYPCASGSFYVEYGTSAAAPSMAGVAALLNQKAGPQGNLNSTLYALAANTANQVFHDTTPASSGVANCSLATPSMCNNSLASPTALTGGLMGYALTTGYDQVTGLGSLDIANFVSAAAAVSATPATAEPVFSPMPGVYVAPFTLILTDPTPGASIYYTLDGSTPTAASTIYKGGVPVNGNATVLAIAVAPGYGASGVVTGNYANTLQTPSVTWPTPAPIVYGTALSSAQLNATASIPGTFAYLPSNGVPLAGAEQLEVVFKPDESSIYTTVTEYVTLTITKAMPAITWAAPASITYGVPLTSTQLNAASSATGVFTYTPTLGTILTAGSHLLTANFAPADTRDYAPATATVSLTVNEVVPTITWTAPAALTYPAPLTSVQLNASSTTPGSFTYAPALGTILGAGKQALSAAFLPTDATDYSGSTTPNSLTINPAPLTAQVSNGMRLYGAANPAGLAALTGVVNGDALTATSTSTASAASPIGSYPLTPVIADPNNRLVNYMLTSTFGTLTVTAAPLTVTTASATRAYGSSNPVFAGTLAGVQNADPITAVYSTSATIFSAPGTQPITAMLSDPAGKVANYSVTNTPGVLTITKAGSTLALTSSAASTASGASITLTGTAGSATSGTPTGQVTFLIGSTVLGTAALNSSGVATLILATLPVGTDPLTASYAGDTNFLASQTASVPVIVGNPDFTLTAGSSSANVNAGQTATYALTLTPAFGFAQATVLTCSGLPVNAACTFSPSTLTPAGAPVSATLTIATDTAAASLSRPAGLSDLSSHMSSRTGLSLAAGLLCLPLIGRRRKIFGVVLTLLLGVFALTVVTGCGGSSSGPGSAPRTPDGTSAITITATAGAITHSSTVTLSVAN